MTLPALHLAIAPLLFVHYLHIKRPQTQLEKLSKMHKLCQISGKNKNGTISLTFTLHIRGP